jgi:carboxypeptidase C (cathepsin A)
MPCGSRALLVATLTALTSLIQAPVDIEAQAQVPKPQAESRKAAPTADEKAKTSEKTKSADKPKDHADDDTPIVTKHQITLDGKPLAYTATAGMMPIRNREGTTEAHIFYIAYTKDDPGPLAARPLMFSFNGGPGSSSVWLHLGALGPKRIAIPDDATMPRPPFALEDNQGAWLDRTDLVFIDPVSTGFSRATKPDLNAKFHGLRGDIDSVGEFIRIYLSRTKRWSSPLFLVGESYGTTRAAGLSDHLVDRGIALNGIVLVSTVLNFQTVRFGTGNDLPYVLYLPSYAATAWYHKKLDDELLELDLEKLVAKAKNWATSTYVEALERGDRLSPDERDKVLNGLARYTGLKRDYLDNSNLRVEIQRFCKELLRSKKRTVGRLDSRYKGIDEDLTSSRLENDPSMSAIRAPYTAAFQQYVHESLGFVTDRPYYILGEGVGNWDFGPSGDGYADTSAALRDALAKNPAMKILVGSGYYDLATPFFAAEYTLAHMNLDPELRKQVSLTYYPAGHMMYVHTPSLLQLKADVARFIDDATNR